MYVSRSVWKKGIALGLAVVMALPLSGGTFSQASAKSVKKIVLSNPKVKTLSLKKGESFQLKVKTSPNGMAKKIAYKSSKKSVVSVNSKGKLKAKKVGKATITIYSKGKTSKKVKLSVTVYKKMKKVKAITLSKKSCVLQPQETIRLKAKITTQKATVQTICWTSSKKTVATVNQRGVVTAKKEGTVQISAYAKDGRGAKAVCKITVKKARPTEPTATVKPTDVPKPTIDPLLTTQKEGAFTVAAKNSAVDIFVDANGKDYDGLSLVASSVAGDIALVSQENATARVVSSAEQMKEYAIIAGSIGNNSVIDSLIMENKIDVSEVQGKRETYRISVVSNPTEHVKKAIVVAGSDKRGTIYGMYHISEKMGVSPWVYWGDAIPEKAETVYLDENELDTTSKEPSVKYRGIFLNDEAPSLTSWTRKKFGGYNEKFYKNVYELILRCKGNYLWPAMWSNTFSEDGKSSKIANAELADQYGIVMGTSHHEPLCRAGVEWQNKYRKYGTSNAWNFNTNEAAITKFWQDGVDRNKKFENIYTLGMRGESDSALSGTKEENIALLKKVITAQKKILAENQLQDAPKVLTVYKEVEDFWHGTANAEGLKKWSELDDVTIMLCDDNFGNMRTLPTKEDQKRKGGWGMYYHFDYHGGPTSYEWVNTIQLEKVWEQMNMAYEHGIDDIWIVNVGDLKPMEMNISYFLDMAYDYDTWGTNGKNKVTEYREKWVNQQFGRALNEDQIKEVESLLDDYTWLNGSGKPESINSTTYHATNYNEGRDMLERIEDMMSRAEKCKKYIPDDLQAAYFQLVYFPTVASANVTRMQIYSGLNKYFAEQKSAAANLYAVKIQEAIELDKELQNTYNKDMPGVGNKWQGMMSSPHVGYVTWNSDGWSYPQPVWVKTSGTAKMLVTVENQKESIQCSEEGTLHDFTNINQESYTVTVSNMGGEAFDYSLSPSVDWIRLSKKNGHVMMQDAFEVWVDWDKVKEDTSGKITISCGEEQIVLNVNARVYNTSSLQKNTFIYANGYASILPGDFVAKGNGKNGTSVAVFDGYGKTGQAVKILPTNVQQSENMADAAYLEYLVQVETAGEYKLTVYTGPSNNLDRDNVAITYGYSVNGSEIVEKSTVDPNSFLAGEYSGSWANDVKVNGRKQENDIALNAGINTIRIYAPDPAFLLQKLVVSQNSVADSNAGPSESYYVGKKLLQSSVLAGVVADCQAVPGEIVATAYHNSDNKGEVLTAKSGAEYEYDVIVTDEDSYRIGVRSKSSAGAQVKLSLDDQELGTIQIGKNEQIYEISELKELAVGKKQLKMTIVAGEANISGIVLKTRDRVAVPGSFDAAGHEESGQKEGSLTAEKGKDYYYSALAEKDEFYKFSIRGRSADHATVTLYWNKEKIGSVQLTEESTTYLLDNPIDIEPGVGSIRLRVSGGEAVIESISSETFDSDVRLPIGISASSELEGYEASKVYDEDTSTSWKPSDSDNEKTITLDFKNAYTIDRFALHQTGDGVEKYVVQTFLHDEWKIIYTGSKVENGKEIFLQGNEPIECEKLRFTFTGKQIEINELLVTPYTNWAMKGKVTLSGLNMNGRDAILVPEDIIDGDRISKGMETDAGTSTDRDRHSVTLTFSAPIMMNAVRLITLQENEAETAGTGKIPDLDMLSGKGQFSYRISYFDGTQWIEIGATQKPDEGLNPKVFTEFVLKRKVKASKIRVEIYTSYWIRINELEAVEMQKFNVVE